MKISATRDVYTFAELSPAAQDKALENLSNVAWECLDSDMVSEDINGEFIYLATNGDGGVASRKELFDKYGIRIYWSVSYSQSDHASIEGKLNRSDLPNLAWPDTVNYARVSHHRYGGSRVELIETDTEAWIEHGELFDATQQMVNDINSNLYRFARKQIEAYTSKDYVLNEYNDFGMTRRFTDEGNFAPNEFWADDNGDNQ